MGQAGTPAVGDSSSTSGAELDRAITVLAGLKIAVLTGAGISTDSGIPDYRGIGTAPRSNPMNIQTFLSSERARKRYWAGSFYGWRRFQAAVPNSGHIAIAKLETGGRISGVITQNVDGLHQRAGTTNLVELHGGVNRVVCLTCNTRVSREEISAQLLATNPHMNIAASPAQRPDGDADVSDDFVDQIVLPKCEQCGGILKPDVVFFGELVPAQQFAEATQILANAEALLIAGSSLVVNSGVRLVERARRRGLPIVIVNRGETRSDKLATVKIDGGTSENLSVIAEELAG